MSKTGRPTRLPPQAQGEDVALICGVSASGDGLNVLRRRNNRIEAGVAHALREGQPIHGEVVKLTPREGSPLLCDVEVQLSPTGAATQDVQGARDSNGPAQVANDTYRRNWDAIWKRPTNNRRLPN